jgi:hypothetical protein
MIIYKASGMESRRVSPPKSKIIDKAAMMKSGPNCGYRTRQRAEKYQCSILK